MQRVRPGSTADEAHGKDASATSGKRSASNLFEDAAEPGHTDGDEGHPDAKRRAMAPSAAPASTSRAPTAGALPEAPQGIEVAVQTAADGNPCTVALSFRDEVTVVG